jgi:subtilase family serine protease
MKLGRRTALVLAASGWVLLVNVLPATAASGSGSVRLDGTASPVAATTPVVGSVAQGSLIDFGMQLNPSHLRGAQALATAVSTPGSASYGRFLTPAQWESRFSPTAGQVSEVKGFLRQRGFTLQAVSADRMEVDASGTAAQIERVFATSLSYHRVDGVKLRLADRDLSVPVALRRVLAGVTGISESLARPDDTAGNPSRAGSSASPAPADLVPGTRRLLRPLATSGHRAAATTTRFSTPPCPRTGTATPIRLRGPRAATDRPSFAALIT